VCRVAAALPPAAVGARLALAVFALASEQPDAPAHEAVVLLLRLAMERIPELAAAVDCAAPSPLVDALAARAATLVA
jgi:hypothetical protein